jgi:thymidylate synthase (FAD)
MGGPVEPSVYLLGSSIIDWDQFNELLADYGVAGWSTDAESDGEALTELYGRACYRSFETETVSASEMNPNLTMVRKSSSAYLTNVLQKGDGSIFEHVQTNWFFRNVTRVLTHELVRHRSGMAYSQESLRFVRLTDLSYYEPEVFRKSERLSQLLRDEWKRQSEWQVMMARELELDTILTFDEKKEVTSALRRPVGQGVATNIGMSCNLRALRHVIEMRTDPAAEEEIRKIFAQVARIARSQWPAIFADYTIETIKGIEWWRTPNKKV